MRLSDFLRARKNYILVLLLLILTAGTVCAWVHSQLLLICYKLCLFLAAGVTGCILDYAVFPYAKPEGYLTDRWDCEFCEHKKDEADFHIVKGHEIDFYVACLRRVVLISVGIIGVCFAL